MAMMEVDRRGQDTATVSAVVDNDLLDVFLTA
jgi:hypothetical protein